MKWRIDVSHATPLDLKSHTSATMTMGGGSISSSSAKKNLHTRSLTESELVVVNDVLRQFIWMINFLNP